VNETSRGVPIAHLAGDLTLVGNEERSGQWRILPESFVYRASGARPDSCEQIGGRRRVRASERTLRRRCRCCDDGRAGKNENQTSTIKPSPCDCHSAAGDGSGNRNPGDAAEPDQKSR